MRRVRPLPLVLLLAVLVAGCARAVSPLPTVGPVATPTPQPVVLPRDARPHDALTEWWYFTGHLRTEDRHEYGFEFTVFQIRRQDAPAGYLAHFAVTDVDGQRFRFQARESQGEPRTELIPPLRVQNWSLSGDDVIEAAMDDGQYAMRLQFTDEKPPAPHHGGFIANEPAGGSYYYSRTRLRASGELEVGGEPHTVSGLAWMDHQWGNFVVVSGGWDWYSLQLDDRSELMLYVLRSGSGGITAVYGSEIVPDGGVGDLAANEVHAEALGTWTSPHSGAVYPSGWRLTLHDREQLVLRPLLDDQELYFAGVGGPTYWEGAVSVEGDRTGRGYVELTGYASR